MWANSTTAGRGYEGENANCGSFQTIHLIMANKIHEKINYIIYSYRIQITTMKLFNTILLLLFLVINLTFFTRKTQCWIVLDDLNDFVGVMKGHPQTQTPNIDKLASQSVLFSNAHSNVPVCSPSRASFMTGVHPLSLGIWGFGNALKEETFINTKSIPEYMKENGYKVFQSGKVFHSNPKNIWDDNGVPADYGPVAYTNKAWVIHQTPQKWPRN